MKYTAKYIKKELNPCESGIENFEQHYPNFEGSLEEILCLDKIPYDNKIWLALKVLDVKDLQQWSVECAEFVLNNFESTMPADTRVRECIEVTKNYLLGECSFEILEAAWVAVESAVFDARSFEFTVKSASESVFSYSARSAAWSAEYAAESAARSARSARSAAESAAESAAKSAASAARSAEYAARSAAKSAAWSAEYAAESAARSAARSAESAASAARSAAWSAIWYAARSATESARSARSEQEDINISLLIAIVANGDY